MKAVIFDMDGTIVDNMVYHHKAWQEKLADLGKPMTFEAVQEQIHGINREILKSLFGNRFTATDRKRISSEKEAIYRRIYEGKLSFIPGLPDFFEHLKAQNIPMAIATAAPPENMNFTIDVLGIRHYFEYTLHAQDVEKGKPHPEIYEKTAALLGVPTTDCLVFEDSPTGAMAASAAGCKVIIVKTTYTEANFEEMKNIVGFIDNFVDIDIDQF